MRHKLTSPIFVSLFCLAWPLLAGADIAVIVHPDNPVRSMTQREVSNLYLGRTRSFTSGDQNQPLSALIYEQRSTSPLRETFFRSLNGMSETQLNAYWARLRFSGEVLPPTRLADSRSVLEAVSNNRSAIGYVDAAEVSNLVKVVLLLRE